MTSTTHSYDAPSSAATSMANLGRLLLVRAIATAGFVAALAYASSKLSLLVPYTLLYGLLLVYLVVSLMVWMRTRLSFPVTHPEFFTHLLFDMVWLGFFLYWSGGANNPFISYLLVPITIAAATLPWIYAGMLTVVGLVAYTLLLFYHVSIVELHPHHGGHNESVFNLHIIGMWVNFLVSALLISVFVFRMANALKESDQRLAQKREEDLRNEQLLGLATFAAGTAHELATPLNTMTLLLKEMKQDATQSDQFLKDIHLMDSQVSHCKKILESLVKTAEENQVGSTLSVPLEEFIEELKKHWQLIVPDTDTDFQVNGEGDYPLIQVDATVMQAVINLLNNAAEVSHKIIVSIDWSQSYVSLNIRDFGPGFDKSILAELGKPFVSTKGKGWGVGLFLSHASLNRVGGSVEIGNHEEGGAFCAVKIPRSGQSNG